MSYDPERERRPPASRKIPFITGLVLLCAGLASIAVGYRLETSRESLPQAIHTLVFHPQALLPPPVPAPQQLFGKGLVRVLVVGLDYDYDGKDQETSAHSRSDVIMALALDTANRKVYELSVPRDMVATLPNGQQGKINQAQSDGGIAESQTVVANWLGIPGFDRYVVLRIDTMKDLIDALGGIDLTVENSDALKHQGPNGPLDYDDSWGHLHVHLAPGYQHLDGERAVGYARFRHDWCSDPCRIMRQQQVIRSIVARIKGDKLNLVLRFNRLIGVLRKDVDTNLSTREELSLAYAYRDATPSSFVSAQVPYVSTVDLPGYGDSIVADDRAKAELVQNMLLAPPGSVPTAPAIAAIAPDGGVAPNTLAASAVHVRVENGSGVHGAAAHVAELLRARGFTVDHVANAPSFGVKRTEVHALSAGQPEAMLVRDALATLPVMAAIVADSDSVEITVVVGSDVAMPAS